MDQTDPADDVPTGGERPIEPIPAPAPHDAAPASNPQANPFASPTPSRSDASSAPLMGFPAAPQASPIVSAPPYYAPPVFTPQHLATQALALAPAAVPETAPAAIPAAGPVRITSTRAFAEIGAVYVASFGLGVLSALALLTRPSLGANQHVHGWLEAGSEMLQYIMQASVVIFGVGYFSLRRGLTLGAIFGRFTPPVVRPFAARGWAPYGYPVRGYPSPANPYGFAQAPQPAANGVPAWGQPIPTNPPTPAWQGTWNGHAAPYGGYPQPAYAPPPPQPGERAVAWQFARVFFLSMAGVLAFLITVVVYDKVTHSQTGAPDPGNSLWIVPVGLVVALAAGFGEEVLITGMVVTTLEQAGFARRAWVIYLVAIVLRIPFHLYYGWASLGVVCFTAVNIWVYRRWRVLWPIVLAHTAYDALQFIGSFAPTLAGLTLLALGVTTLVMVVVIACIELSDRSARRRFAQWKSAVGV